MLDCDSGMWSIACQSNSTRPVAMSISWTSASITWRFRPGSRTGEIAMMYASPWGVISNSCRSTDRPLAARTVAISWYLSLKMTPSPRPLPEFVLP